MVYQHKILKQKYTFSIAMKFYIISLGCQMNISDTERIKTALYEIGLEETKTEEDATLLGVMACSVRQKAIDRVYSIIHSWNRRKNTTPLLTFLSGCILPSDKEKFLKKFDILFSINELPALKDMILQSGTNIGLSIDSHTPPLSTPLSHKKNTSATHSIPFIAHKKTTFDFSRSFWKYKPSYSSHFSAYVAIQNGCDKFCTFCAVPYTRGREISRPFSEILDEVHFLMKKKYKSITLLGQNVNSYGNDINDSNTSFVQLLTHIGSMAKELNHDCWIYFTSPHPRDMNNNILETIAQYDALAKQIHLPLQSGDDKLLMKMNRNHSMNKYDKIVTDIRRLLPQATLFTDIIVGFCEESEEQFKNTQIAMEKYKYNMAYIAMYSPRPGAASSRWNDTISIAEKKQRYRLLSRVLESTSLEYNKKNLHTYKKVLIEGFAARKKNILKGHTEGKIPVYITIPDADSRTIESMQKALIGTFANIYITHAHNLSLEGRIYANSIKEAHFS